ncbi:sigma-70 family RNA polymerase sigma factor [Mucilaginibacter sp. BJC16-A38]|uniref:RNA polymerase sigma factor n=1 Tax=Mucilaginibacter phenanthrenivorans TaxID=1234842 RepID=UPI00215768D3|nr:sigma-70 family RNA polymerase sigma factor [Mucilaginibacter phenanthrenivorans]MCR8557396.1 sigma-70 family RNA polymerase sigma factor [Mucilaginibacter phenanthrenivorans]
MLNEKEIVSRIIKGDFRAFELLVKEYERLVFFVINRLVHDVQDKEDICQEVFIKVHKSLPKFKFESKLSTWIARIAYLTAINYLKKYRNDRQTDYPENIDNYHFTDDNPEQVLTRKNASEYLNGLIAQMPLAYRTALTLYHLNEFSCQEIEQITGTPEGTIKSNLFRARKLLKEKIEKDQKNEQI